MLTLTTLEQSPFNPLRLDAADGTFNPFLHSGCYQNSVLFIKDSYVAIVAFKLKKPRNETQTHKAAFVPLFTDGELTTSLWLWSETSYLPQFTQDCCLEHCLLISTDNIKLSFKLYHLGVLWGQTQVITHVAPKTCDVHSS